MKSPFENLSNLIQGESLDSKNYESLIERAKDLLGDCYNEDAINLLTALKTPREVGELLDQLEAEINKRFGYDKEHVKESFVNQCLKDLIE